MAVEKLFIELAKAGAKEFAPFPISTVLIYLIDELAQQEETLSSSERKLEQHIIAPFKEGRVYLEEARHATSEADRRAHLIAARKNFISISQIDLPNYPLLRIWACFYVGVCYGLLSDGKNALRWYEKAHQLVVRTIVAQDPRRQRDSKTDQFWTRQVIDEYSGQFGLFRVNIPATLHTATGSQAIRHVALRNKLQDLGRFGSWPMGEQVTRDMFILAVRLTDLIAVKKLKAGNKKIASSTT